MSHLTGKNGLAAVIEKYEVEQKIEQDLKTEYVHASRTYRDDSAGASSPAGGGSSTHSSDSGGGEIPKMIMPDRMESIAGRFVEGGSSKEVEFPTDAIIEVTYWSKAGEEASLSISAVDPSGQAPEVTLQGGDRATLDISSDSSITFLVKGPADVQYTVLISVWESGPSNN